MRVRHMHNYTEEGRMLTFRLIPQLDGEEVRHPLFCKNRSRQSCRLVVQLTVEAHRDGSLQLRGERNELRAEREGGRRIGGAGDRIVHS